MSPARRRRTRIPISSRRLPDRYLEKMSSDVKRILLAIAATLLLLLLSPINVFSAGGEQPRKVGKGVNGCAGRQLKFAIVRHFSGSGRIWTSWQRVCKPDGRTAGALFILSFVKTIGGGMKIKNRNTRRDLVRQTDCCGLYLRYGKAACAHCPRNGPRTTSSSEGRAKHVEERAWHGHPGAHALA